MKLVRGFAVALSVALAILSILLVGNIARLDDDLAIEDQVASGDSLVEMPAMPSDLQSWRVREIRSIEHKDFDGPVRIDAGRALFSHFNQSGNSHNIVAMNIDDGSARNLVEGVFEGNFVAEDARYLVYSSVGFTANPLVVIDKGTNQRVASVRLQRSHIPWGHITGDRLLIAQGGVSHNGKLTMLVYSLPDLKFERSTEITGGYGHNIAVWGDKIVSVDHQLGIYDLDLREIAVVDLPKSAPDLRVSCGSGPLRISGNKAVIGASCSNLVIVDLPSARIERIIPDAAPTQSLSIADGLIFALERGGQTPLVRVIELSSGRELSRFRIDAIEIALHGKSLLAMKYKNFLTPARFTLYEVDFAQIRSEPSRIARTLSGCRAARQTLELQRDLHGALDACERAGIRAYIEEAWLSPDLRTALQNYAQWLTASFSRYAEGSMILGRLQRTAPDIWIESQIAMARRKAMHLDLPPENVPPSSLPEPQGVKRVSVDFGMNPDLARFEGDRLHVARRDCDGTPSNGVTLDVLDRQSFHAIKRIAIADCDDDQQDSINAIGFVPGYIVLGLTYLDDEVGRPTFAVVDARTLEVVKKGFVQHEIAGLSQWEGRLLACASSAEQPHQRFDPVRARLVAATKDEARACANVESLRLMGNAANTSRQGPMAEMPHYRAHAVSERSGYAYRITNKQTGATRTAHLAEGQYSQALSVPDRDAFITRYESWLRLRFAYYDVETEAETVLLELNLLDRWNAAAVWSRYLFVSLGRDLLVYDLDRRMVVGYEKELIREGAKSCCGAVRNDIFKLLVDQGRLIALTLDGSNNRIIDLPVYTAGLPMRDFFLAHEEPTQHPYPTNPPGHHGGLHLP